MTPAARIRPVGERALTVEFGRELDLTTAARVRALDADLYARPCRGFVEAVPCCASLLVVYDPLRSGFDELCAELHARLATLVVRASPTHLHRLAVRYGGDDGPDLEPLAHALHLSPAQLVEQHAATTYTVLMLGFLPGFPYLGLLPEALTCRRHATPRTRVPAGSVGLAGRQTGIYPSASPGGWQIIGRSATRLFDAHADPPQRVQPGDRVRFEPVEALPDAGEPSEPAVHAAAVSGVAATLEVLEPGWGTSVQAGIRSGWRRCGVPGSGALDRAALAQANTAVGNLPDAPALELCGPGLALRLAGRACRIALAGADLGPTLVRADLGAWSVPALRPVLMRPGNVLALGARQAGLRAYLAFEGGLDVAPVLGSTSTDLTAGFGGWRGRALRRGDVLALRSRGASCVTGTPASRPLTAEPLLLRVVLGPQEDAFEPAAVHTLLESEWQVTAASDRIGCRLQGPSLRHVGPSEMLSDGLMPGCIQVPPDGQPIVTLADGPTTGGYPKIATIVEADLDTLAQALPESTRVRFAVVTVQDAQRARSWEVRRSFVSSSGLL